MFLHLHTKAITLIQRIWCQIIADTKVLIKGVFPKHLTYLNTQNENFVYFFPPQVIFPTRCRIYSFILSY